MQDSAQFVQLAQTLCYDLARAEKATDGKIAMPIPEIIQCCHLTISSAFVQDKSLPMCFCFSWCFVCGGFVLFCCCCLCGFSYTMGL